MDGYVEIGKVHQARDKMRRKWSIEKRASLRPRELLVWMDFFSFFSKDQQLVHTLCYVLEWRDDGVALRNYVDFPCADKASNSSNNYFIATAWLQLLENTDHVISHTGAHPVNKFDHITVVCDNAIVSKYHLATLVALDKLFRISFELCPLCARHASSLCDSHAGHAKPAGKRAYLKNTSPADLKELFEGVVKDGSARFKDTFVYPLASINHDVINERIYKRFGGRDQVRSIPNLRNFGQLKLVRGVDHQIGHVACRYVHGEPAAWPFQDPWPGPQFQDAGYLIYPLQKTAEHFCVKCSHVHNRPMWKTADHVCLFSKARAAGNKRAQPNSNKVRRRKRIAPESEDEEIDHEAQVEAQDEKPELEDKEEEDEAEEDEDEEDVCSWMPDDFAWKGYTKDDWPEIKECGTTVNVDAESGVRVGVYCTHDEDSFAIAFKRTTAEAAGMRACDALEYVLQANPGLKRLEQKSKLQKHTLLAVPITYPPRLAGRAVEPPKPALPSKPRQRDRERSPSPVPLTSPAAGTGLAIVDPANVLHTSRRPGRTGRVTNAEASTSSSSRQAKKRARRT